MRARDLVAAAVLALACSCTAPGGRPQLDLPAAERLADRSAAALEGVGRVAHSLEPAADVFVPGAGTVLGGVGAVALAAAAALRRRRRRREAAGEELEAP